MNFIERDYHRVCRVIGTSGTIAWDFAAHRVDLYDPEGACRESFPEPPGWELNQMYLDELEHFLTAVAERRETCCGVADGLAALRVALTVREQGV